MTNLALQNWAYLASPAYPMCLRCLTYLTYLTDQTGTAQGNEGYLCQETRLDDEENEGGQEVEGETGRIQRDAYKGRTGDSPLRKCQAYSVFF